MSKCMQYTSAIQVDPRYLNLIANVIIIADIVSADSDSADIQTWLMS